MSFFTSLSFYRPTMPPPVTADDLSRFIAKIRDTQLLTDEGLRTLQVKFGHSIDQDDLGTSRDIEVAPRMFQMGEIEWDVNLRGQHPSLQEIIDRLASDRRRVYRAYASLGQPTDDVLRPITRQDSPENKHDYVPDTLSIEIGPVELHTLGSDTPALAGWIDVGFSGYGYLYPWKFRDVLRRLESNPEIQRLENVCREFWPVAPATPAREIVEVRREMGDMWPYPEIDKPWDWYWGPQES